MSSFTEKTNVSLSLLIVASSVLLFSFTFIQVEGFNDDRGIVKWNPYWFYSGTGSKFSEPVSYYGGISRGSLAYPKRFGERSSLYGTHQIYKWSPVYFSDRGLFSRPRGVRNLNIISNDGFDSGEK